MMARNTIVVPSKGRIQKRKTNHLRIVIFGLQRAAGPYRWATSQTSRDPPSADEPGVPVRLCSQGGRGPSSSPTVSPFGIQ
jgi:hypothetical protein